MNSSGNRSPLVAAATSVAALFLLMPARTTSSPRSSRDGGSLVANADVEVSPAAAQALEEKMRLLATPVPNTAKSLAPVTISETEANSYLKYRGQSFLPPAVHDPEVHITSDRVSGAAEVDFDQLNQQAAKADDWATRAMTSIFSGRQRVNATGKLETRNGQGKATIESASIGNTALPPQPRQKPSVTATKYGGSYPQLLSSELFSSVASVRSFSVRSCSAGSENSELR